MSNRKRVSPRLTAEIAARIKRIYLDTGWAQHQIAAEVGVNQGRVCEVLNGKRFSNVPPSPH
jgi:transcriptional regulator with XRE-family HTH domain